MICEYWEWSKMMIHAHMENAQIDITTMLKEDLKCAMGTRLDDFPSRIVPM